MSKITVIGTGYVGLVSGALLSDFGHQVICVDIDHEKINKLQQGEVPIYEPGLASIVEANCYYKRLSFTVSFKEAIETSKVIFIAVGTPAREDGKADVQAVLKAAKEIGTYINEYKIVVDKSTVPIGTGKKVKEIIEAVLKEREKQIPFDVVSNPEFLREGSAVHDFSHPDRVVLGTESKKALNVMKDVYGVLYLNETPFIETNLETAEMIKYASNAFLAMKITYVNEIADLCERVGANIQDVARAMGRDGRISPKFLHAGPGYGGSCFPKDTKALAQIAKENGISISLIDATIHANEKRKKSMAEKIQKAMGSVKGKKLAVLGITFKPNTDDMRESPSLTILPQLVQQGADLRIFDPKWEKEGKWRLEQIKDHIVFCQNEYEAMVGVDAIILLTEWNQFRNLEFNRMKELVHGKYFFDFRNIYQRKEVEQYGFQYYGVGC